MEDKDRYRIVIDVDGTLAHLKAPDQNYEDLEPVAEVVAALKSYFDRGYYIIVQSSRNMRTYQNNLGLLQAHTLPKLIDWLTRHEIPFHEVHVGKPWCGFNGFYVDDKAIRPDEFVALSPEEIEKMVGIGGA